jgi:hypothetical protein
MLAAGALVGARAPSLTPAPVAPTKWRVPCLRGSALHSLLRRGAGAKPVEVSRLFSPDDRRIVGAGGNDIPLLAPALSVPLGRDPRGYARRAATRAA